MEEKNWWISLREMITCLERIDSELFICTDWTYVFCLNLKITNLADGFNVIQDKISGLSSNCPRSQTIQKNLYPEYLKSTLM